jgi:hypothetical protein
MRFLNPAKDSDQQGNFGDSLCKDYWFLKFSFYNPSHKLWAIVSNSIKVHDQILVIGSLTHKH